MFFSISNSILYAVLIFQLCNCQQCMTKKPQPCIFPFEYQNKIYYGCKPDEEKPEKSWCSTQVDEEGRHVEGKGGETWGYCSTDCPVYVEGDQECEETRQCINSLECPELREFRKMPKTHPDYQTEKNKWVGRICNKKEKKLCCSRTNKPQITASPPTIPPTSPTPPTTPKPTTDTSPTNTIISLNSNLELQPTNSTTKPEKEINVCDGRQEYPGNYLPSLGQCGKYCSTSRISGGVNAGLGEFPWAALLGYKIIKRVQVYQKGWVNKAFTEFRCGGTLINTRYVLTAAHCHTSGTGISSVVLGEWQVGKDPDCPEGNRDQKSCKPRRQKIKVESVKIHKDYRKDTRNGEVVNDIALIRLEKHAVLNEAVQPICLPFNEEETTEEIGVENLEEGIIGRDATIIGWGTIESFASKNTDCQGVPECILQKVDIPIISNEDCQSEVDILSPNENATIRSTHICAFDDETKNKDSCKGDSGGGMFISKNLDDKTDDTYYQVGIVSYGLSRFCGIGYPGVYTRITEFIPWIKDNLQD